MYAPDSYLTFPLGLTRCPIMIQVETVQLLEGSGNNSQKMLSILQLC